MQTGNPNHAYHPFTSGFPSALLTLITNNFFCKYRILIHFPHGSMLFVAGIDLPDNPTKTGSYAEILGPKQNCLKNI